MDSGRSPLDGTGHAPFGIFNCLDRVEAVMNRWRSLLQAGKIVVHNPFATIAISVLYAITTIPFLLSFNYPMTFGWVVGLWTSSLLWGTVSIAGFRFGAYVVDPEELLTWRQFLHDVRFRITNALVIGIGTFFVALVSIVLISNRYAGVYGGALFLTGIYLLLLWFLFASLAVSLHVSRDLRLSRSFLESFVVTFENPWRMTWFGLSVTGLTILAGLTVIALCILLPGIFVFYTLITVDSV